MFIELTLKSEQEEYLQENIEVLYIRGGASDDCFHWLYQYSGNLWSILIIRSFVI